MKKFLEKLPIEGLLIIVVALITLIIIVYLTKIESVIKSNNKIIITDINHESENSALFSSQNDIENQIVLDNPEPKQMESVVTEQKRKVRLFYVKVDDDGTINIKSVLKTINVGKSPLTKTIERLIKGTDIQDINSGLLSLIPDATELLSVSINDGIAYLDLNEMFRFNSLGVEGYINQIKQIVYTATEYETVTSVQFSIDGAIHEYLGPEGVYIGRPISRDDF